MMNWDIVLALVKFAVVIIVLRAIVKRACT